MANACVVAFGPHICGGNAVSSENAADLVGESVGRGARPEQPEPFLRGCAWPGTRHVPYPRADPVDRMRLPKDTWQMATIPVGVRFEVVGGADAVALDYTTTTDQLGYRGDGAGTTFEAWVGDERAAVVDAVLGDGTVELPLSGDAPTSVHLPEGMKPIVHAVRGVGGDIAPAPRQPRWVVYGDSVAEGWIASAPSGAWPAVAGRRAGADVVNLGYAGAARGEIASAEQVAGLSADVFTVAHGTNCWTRIPHSVDAFRAGVAAWLTILRDAHPTTPIVVVSPVVRPDAEATPNRLGATLADLRMAMEDETRTRIDAGDEQLHLLGGLDLMGPELLGDGIHPDDDGHRAVGAAVADALRIALAGAG